MELPTYETNDFLNKFVRVRKVIAKPLKKQFLRTFCDTQSPRYHRLLLEPYHSCYTAMHHNWKLVSKAYLEKTPPFNGNVFVGWDYEDYYVPMYALGKYYLFEMPFSKFLEHYIHFPASTYVFDQHLNHALVSAPSEFTYFTPYMRLYDREPLNIPHNGNEPVL